jgi:hypothetical protein
MQAIRSIVAVVGGYLIFSLPAVVLFQATGRAPHAPATVPFMVLAAGYGMCFAGLGGWFAARVSRLRPLLHGSLVALLIATGATASLLFSGAAATWSQWEALLLMAPMAVVGVLIRSRSRGASA